MEYFRRLLGALQETLVSTPAFNRVWVGARTARLSRRDVLAALADGLCSVFLCLHPIHRIMFLPSPRTSLEMKLIQERKEQDVQGNWSAVAAVITQKDISPHLNAFERPRTIEVTPFNQELRVPSEAVGHGTQTTEATLEPSKLACKREAQEAYGQKLSETPQFLADAPKPSPTATMLGNDRQRDLEGLALIQGVHQWEPEGTTLMEGIQPEGLEEVGLNSESSPHWEPDRPVAGEGEQNGAGGTDGAQQRGLEGTVWTEEMEQKTPDWALFLTEQPCGTGEIKHARLKAESQRLKEEEEEESAAETDWGQQGEANEGIQQGTLERGETEGEQEGLLEEAIRRHWWEPGETVMTFEEQDWDPKRGAEEGNSLQSGLEGAKHTEDHQQGEPEGPLRNEALIEDKRWEEYMEGVWGGPSERLVEEDLEDEVLEKTETRGEPEWTERGLWEEPTGSRASCEAGLDAGERIVGEPERLVEKLEKEEVAEVVMLEDAETSGNWKWEPEGTERTLHEELMGGRGPLNTCLFGGEQIVGKPEKLTGEQEPIEVVVLEEAETGGGTQPWEPEGSLLEEPKGSNTSLLGIHLFGGEQTVVEPEALTEDREEVAVAVVVLEEAETGGHQPWEPEGNLHEEPKGINSSLLDMHLFGGKQTVVKPEGLTEEQEAAAVVVLEEAETGGHQPWEPETKERSLQQDPTESRIPFIEEPEKMTEEQEAASAVVALEEADTGGHQPWEPEGSLHEEPMGSRLFAGPSTLLDEVLPLDTSAQKERVMLRRKSSIRRAPSLKKPRLPMETQPMETQPPAANLTEPVPSQPQAPRQPNPRHSGFGPMHPNMMAELQMRLRRPQ
ncbi:hypothetical protein lerEdw1_006947 [Lerista edwardsae]|nr:hypothetical protein lerEdw1_006947 [Lerista edwardsae]